ncbi:MAG TPA: hypothetical protein VHE12_01500 [bacterium]|nr:hypothetical protein [bacterium]
MKKLVLILFVACMAALPLACADRDFKTPVSPTFSNSPDNGLSATPTP